MIYTRRIAALAILLTLAIALLATSCEDGGAAGWPPKTTTQARFATPSSSSTPLPPTETPSLAFTPTRPSIPTATSEPISWTGPLLYDPWALQSPSLDWVPGATRIAVYDVGGGKLLWIPTDKPVYRVLEWSPDGCYATYVSGTPESGGTLHLLSINSMEDRQITSILPGPETATWLNLRWSPTGEWIAYSRDTEVPVSEIYLVRPDGSESHQLTNNEYADVLHDWTSDGRQLIYWSFRPAQDASDYEGTYELNALDIATREKHTVARFTQQQERWSDLVITDINTLQPVELDWPDELQGDFGVSIELYWTPDFRYFVVMPYVSWFEGAYDSLGLYWIDVAGTQVRAIGLNEDEQLFFASPVSPDGHWSVLLTVSYSADKGKRWHAYLLDMRNGETVSIARDQEDSILQFPHWSPDSTMLSYRVDMYGAEPGVYIYYLEAREAARLPGVFSESLFTPLWSPRISYGLGACLEGSEGK